MPKSDILPIEISTDREWPPHDPQTSVSSENDDCLLRTRESFEAQPWIAWYSYETQMYLYRSRRSVTVREDIGGRRMASYINLGGHSLVTIPDDVQQQARFTNGQGVHIVAELSINNRDQIRPHPCRWIRFPHVGRNPELEKLECIGLRIEWEDPNSSQWYSAYVERSKLWEEFPTTTGDILAIYRTGLAIWMDLREIDYTGKPDWVAPRHGALVQYLNYNHLQQKLTTSIVRATTHPWPADYTIDQNGPRIRAILPWPQFANVSIGQRPAGVPSLNRRACDLCLSQRTVSHFDGKAICTILIIADCRLHIHSGLTHLQVLQCPAQALHIYQHGPGRASNGHEARQCS